LESFGEKFFKKISSFTPVAVHSTSSQGDQLVTDMVSPCPRLSEMQKL